MKIKDCLDYELKDDLTENGGISFLGEKVKDFVDETDISYDDDLSVLNKFLVECGIIAIKED